MKNISKKEEVVLKAFTVASGEKELLYSFLKDILTEREWNVLIKRWEIITRLHKGEKQWSIANDLKIGIGTVTRGSRELKDKNGGFVKVLKKLYK